MIFAILSFIANTIDIECVQKLLIGNDKACSILFDILVKSEKEDIWHRVLWIVDEIKEKIKIK